MGVTLIQIAREAGVSITTVSRVLNGTAGEIRISDDTQRRVRDAAERLDYKPNILARGLRSGRSSLIGLILGDAGSLAGILEGVERSATARGYGLLVRTTGVSGEEEIASTKYLLEKQVDGLIVSSAMYVCESVRSHIARLADKGVPIVLLGQKHGPTPQVPFVGFDNRAVGRMATRYLLSLGHRSILCVTNTHNSNIVGMLRRDGYKDALTAAGVEVDQELIVEINPARSSYPLAAYDMLKAYLQTHKTFSAVFSHCDWASLGILKALREAGHGIPESISIVSEGEQPFAHYTDPPLTTVRLDSVKAGKTAARVLLDILDGKEAPSETLLEPELVERQSCAKAMR